MDHALHCHLPWGLTAIPGDRARAVWVPQRWGGVGAGGQGVATANKWACAPGAVGVIEAPSMSALPPQPPTPAAPLKDCCTLRPHLPAGTPAPTCCPELFRGVLWAPRPLWPLSDNQQMFSECQGSCICLSSSCLVDIPAGRPHCECLPRMSRSDHITSLQWPCPCRP